MAIGQHEWAIKAANGERGIVKENK